MEHCMCDPSLLGVQGGNTKCSEGKANSQCFPWLAFAQNYSPTELSGVSQNTRVVFPRCQAKGSLQINA